LPGQNGANINSPGITIDADDSPTGRLETDDIFDNPESDGDGYMDSAASAHFGDTTESAFDDDIIEEEDED
jgi:hypothetical protein